MKALRNAYIYILVCLNFFAKLSALVNSVFHLNVVFFPPRLLPSKYKLTEMPGIPDFSELFQILVVYYGIVDDTGKITEKKECNENLTSAQ